MGWDSNFFTDGKNVFDSQKKSNERTHEEKKFKHCSNCNQPIGAVSTTLYEIDEKHYCPECYHRTIVKQAVERDHYDLRIEKET